MDSHALRQLLRQVREGSLDEEAALQRLRHLPFEDIGIARVDHHRSVRQGFPEVIYGAGKTPAQIAAIFERLVERSSENILITRTSAEVHGLIQQRHAEAKWYEDCRCVALHRRNEHNGCGVIAVVSAGTSDIPVASEAALTARLMGHTVDVIHDVGVAGIHRLFAVSERILAANVLIVVAGMEGALPSVVGGLVSRPVIAVPTSVGYGTGANGYAALLAMLNSCASGIGVVNIDNGFGAGFLAALINQSGSRTGQPCSPTTEEPTTGQADDEKL